MITLSVSILLTFIHWSVTEVVGISSLTVIYRKTVYHVCVFSAITCIHCVVDVSEDNSTIITGGVVGASIILVLIIILIVGVVFTVLRHKHKEPLSRGRPCTDALINLHDTSSEKIYHGNVVGSVCVCGGGGGRGGGGAN